MREVDRDPLPADSDKQKSTEYEPVFDYFKENPPRKPKEVIGEYVASCGFNVPLVDYDDFKKTLEEGVLMFRSELEQDYDGFSEVLSSARLYRDNMIFELTNNRGYYTGIEFYENFVDLTLRSLASGELDPIEYMDRLRAQYSWEHSSILEQAEKYGYENYFHINRPEVSFWRFIEGTNIRIFGDPNVEGRYHLGVESTQSPYLETTPYPGPGYYQINAGEYDQPKWFRKHDRQPFIARSCIDFYEKIKELPKFDTTQSPVMELQIDEEENLHFLQYLKTNLPIEYVEAFDLPKLKNALRTRNVRGITSQTGKEMRLFFNPSFFVEGMEGEAIFHDPLSRFSTNDYYLQFASRLAGFILHSTYISFQDNHFDSAALYRPELAAGCSDLEGTHEDVFKRLNEIVDSTRAYGGQIVNYLDIRVISNGREAVIESDWVLKQIAYKDI